MLEPAPVELVVNPALYGEAQAILARNDVDALARMLTALRLIGWSAHSGTARFGPKAQTARWGMGPGPDRQA